MKTLLLTLLTTILSIGSIKSADTKPNIVFIMADDLSPEYLSSYGKTGVSTPNIDSIGKRGIKFKTAWATSICGSTRTLLMNGRFADDTNMYHNNFSGFKNVDTDVNRFLTLGEVMQSSGYTTQFVGKWGVPGEIYHYDDIVLWETDERSKGMENSKLASRYWYPAISQNGVLLDTNKNDFGPDVFNEKVLNFIEDATTPYFVFYSMVAPHGMRDHDYPVVPNGKKGSLKQNYKNLVKYIDKQVGEILNAVDDNTIVIFCSDNATAREGKQENVERGCRVPFLICGGPIVNKGYTKQLLSFADIMPTFADLAGYDKKIISDGISIVPFLTSSYPLTRKKMFSNIGTSRLMTDGKSRIESMDKVRKNPKGDFVRGNKHRKSKGKVYNSLRRYGTHIGGRLLSKNSREFRTSRGRQFIRFWIKLGLKENK